MVASQNAHVEVVDKLLQHGARVDLQTEVCSIPNGYNDVWGLTLTSLSKLMETYSFVHTHTKCVSSYLMALKMCIYL